MASHDKSPYCSLCRKLSRMKQEWYKSHCRECHSWGSSPLYYLIFRLEARHNDDQAMLKHLNRKVNSLFRWIIQDLEPALRASHTHLPEETFLKVLSIASK